MSVPIPHRVPIRFGDIDVLGHVNNACFFTYFEDARIAFLPKVGIPLGTGDARALARIELDYLKPLLLAHREVEILTSITALGNRSFTLSQEMRSADDVHARAVSVVVAFDAKSQRSRDFAVVERAALAVALAAGEA